MTRVKLLSCGFDLTNGRNTIGPWDGGAIKEAASKGCFDALKFLLDNGCPFGEQAQNKWLRYGFGYNYGNLK